MVVRVLPPPYGHSATPPSPALVYSLLFSVATDKTGSVWDLEAVSRVRRFKEHTSIVNSCTATMRGDQFVITGSDDGTVKVCVCVLCARMCVCVYMFVYIVKRENYSKAYDGSVVGILYVQYVFQCVLC